MTLLDKQTTSNHFILDNEEVIQENFRLRSSDGLSLNVHSWRGPTAPDKTMLVVHGMGGHGAYYARALAPYLVPAGTALYALDLRGHGLSEGVRGDIETFSHFQQDLTVLARHIRAQHPGLPLFMLGESMGTSIAINYATGAVGTDRPDFLALISCVIAPTVKPRPDEVFRTVYYFARDRRRVAIPITGREEQGIADRDFIQVLKTDELFNRKVSIRFLSCMTQGMRQATLAAPRLTLPVFMAQAGRDITINHRRTRAFFKRIAASDKELHYFPQALHALLNDPHSPDLREKLLGWIERQHRTYRAG